MARPLRADLQWQSWYVKQLKFGLKWPFRILLRSMQMAAYFSWRKTAAGDLSECLQLHPAKNGAETVGTSAALAAWRRLFNLTHASRSALVEMHCRGKCEIVGFGFATFVKKSFAEAEVRDPRPGLNSRIIESLGRRNVVVATYEEVRDANTCGDLQQVILDTSWKSSGLNAEQVDQVRILLGKAYQELYAGYRFARILSEMVDELGLWHLHGQRTFPIVDRFAAYRSANPSTTWNPDRGLAVATHESIRTDPHSIAAALFQLHNRPKFPFTCLEQQLLETALEGADDPAAAKALFVTVPAIKRRWARIFERVAAVMPELCPADMDGTNGTRGARKRQRILAYIRNHPEELRPFKN